MIIFGTRGKSLTYQDIPALDCTHCKTGMSVTPVFVQRYFHIFWIPVFPTSKKGMTQCSHCKQLMYEKEMPPAMRGPYNEAKSKVKTPIKYFTGLILLGLLMTAIIISIYTTGKNNIRYGNDPKAGDIYEIKDNGNYTLYKVSKVTHDSVFVIHHLQSSTKFSGLSRLKKTDAYTEDAYPLSKAEIRSMLDRKNISRINRN